jgi:hypothetical protein
MYDIHNSDGNIGIVLIVSVVLSNVPIIVCGSSLLIAVVALVLMGIDIVDIGPCGSASFYMQELLGSIKQQWYGASCMS